MIMKPHHRSKIGSGFVRATLTKPLPIMNGWPPHSSATSRRPHPAPASQRARRSCANTDSAQRVLPTFRMITKGGRPQRVYRLFRLTLDSRFITYLLFRSRYFENDFSTRSSAGLEVAL